MKYVRFYLPLVWLALFTTSAISAQEDIDILMDDSDVSVPVESEPTEKEIFTQRVTTARSLMGTLKYSNHTHFSMDTTYAVSYNNLPLDTVHIFRYRCDIAESKEKLITVFSNELKFSKKKSKVAASRLLQILPEQVCAITASPVIAEGMVLKQESEFAKSKSKYKTYYYFDDDGRLTRRVNYSDYNNNRWVKTGDYNFFYENGELAKSIDSTFLDTWYTAKVELDNIAYKTYYSWGGKKDTKVDEYHNGVKREKPRKITSAIFDDQNRLIEQTSKDFSGEHTLKVRYLEGAIEITTLVKMDSYTRDPEVFTFYPILKK